MKSSLSLVKLIPVSLVLFSSFFGAGNLLFPPLFGYLSGSNLNIATLGFCITGVGLPILGVLAIAMTGGTDLTEVAAPVNITYAKIIMFLSSMAIGPLFAIPRTAAFSYEIGIKPLFGTTEPWQLAVYSALYFAFSYYVANNPSKVLNWLGKVLTPALLACLAVLFVKVLLAPSFTPDAPQGAYLEAPFLKGFQEGYNTMDLLASFLFGASTLTSIKTLGIDGKKMLIKTCLWAGLIAAGLLAVIYYFLGYAGAESHRYLSGEFSNGAGILVATAHEYLGAGGTGILSAIIILACLTTSIGLIAAISDYFYILFAGRLSKQTLGILIALLSFSLSNFGLDRIIKMAIPILCFLYPVMIALALLNVFGFGGNKRVFRCTMWIVTLFAIFEGMKAASIPVPMENMLTIVPLYAEGFGWFTVAVMGAAAGVLWDRMKE
ncbi:MAG: branched-chain amino acid transport system II carrier protein [Acidaminococcaceae bacterium]|nr:branched-chain amino acid transport system II carrier protein [Acidaminococcaceae bacterium]